KIHIEEERFYYCLSEVGNTVSNSIPIALKTALDDGDINGKMKVAIAGFGVGYSWGSTILYFNS
ncbi:3-oxoacyl-[acyl-carrier-protein] synthase III family protein, partial [Bacteroides fragilis str. S13 L11]